MATVTQWTTSILKLHFADFRFCSLTVQEGQSLLPCRSRLTEEILTDMAAAACALTCGFGKIFNLLSKFCIWENGSTEELSTSALGLCACLVTELQPGVVLWFSVEWSFPLHYPPLNCALIFIWSYAWVSHNLYQKQRVSLTRVWGLREESILRYTL